jgi:nucleotide-binding universal stress UspA family protein
MAETEQDMNQRIDSILCCVGLRSDSEGVLSQAANLALATGAQLHVLHVIKPLADDVRDTLRSTIRNRDALEGFMRQRIDMARQQLEDKIDDFLKRHAEQSQAVTERLASIEVHEGHPASLINEIASRRGCDFIVIAANKHGLTPSYAGKVAKGVLKRAHVPVIVVPGPA